MFVFSYIVLSILRDKIFNFYDSSTIFPNSFVSMSVFLSTIFKWLLQEILIRGVEFGHA